MKDSASAFAAQEYFLPEMLLAARAAKLAEQHVVENFTHMPEVYLDGCTCGNNRPRGFLLTTCKKVVVENCTFYDMNSALECAGDANDWFESGPVTDVTIRHNRFVNAAYAGGNVITIAPVIKENIGQTYHRGIRIEENHFQLHEKRFLYARSVDGLIFCALSYIFFVGQAAETPHEPIALRDAAADFLSLDDYESRVRAKNDAMMLRAAAETNKKARRPLFIRDVRFFLNSVDHGLTVMRSAGVDARCDRVEEGDDILLTIRIPKAKAAR